MLQTPDPNTCDWFRMVGTQGTCIWKQPYPHVCAPDVNCGYERKLTTADIVRQSGEKIT